MFNKLIDWLVPPAPRQKNRQVVTSAEVDGVRVDFDKPVSIWAALNEARRGAD